MYLKHLEILGFKSFAKKGFLDFNASITAIVGPNGSGKSNVTEAMRFVLGEQSLKSMRGKRGEDLIFNGSKSSSRSNRASVSIVFDNKDRKFSKTSELGVDIDYDEITLTREVYRDGTNQYLINGTQVRLKDILNFLATMNIGSSGHHIISQGEADRVLNANSKEKRAMIEDALGLKIYQYKKIESEKKLAKTTENTKEVELQRKEIAPHLRFLKRQVEKIEKSQILRDELKGEYLVYLKKEENYLKKQKEFIFSMKDSLQGEIDSLNSELENSEEILSSVSSENKKLNTLRSFEQELEKIRSQKDELLRKIGRIEGMVELENKRTQKIKERLEALDDKMIPLSSVKKVFTQIQDKIVNIFSIDGVSEIRNGLDSIKNTIEEFMSVQIPKDATVLDGRDQEEGEKMIEEKKKLTSEIELSIKKESEVLNQVNNLRQEIDREKDSYRDIEKKVFEIRTKRNSSLSQLELNKREAESLRREEENFKNEIREGGVLVGRGIFDYDKISIDNIEMEEDREIQENKRREIEKMKIRLEDMMGGDSAEESLREYKDITERDDFLEKEIDDLNKSTESLRTLINDLTEKLDIEFKKGVNKINIQFQEFFALMFGGGSASLSIVRQKIKKRNNLDLIMSEQDLALRGEEEEEGEDGVDIEVSLPRKKIRGLQMLSGGERALTSIALLFAISQVNPPPFLVLDETDAALDEANSRKYGNMLENLSKYSQLIVVTHNRETMSRANILYGVTMGADAASKLLSIKFDEAVEVAK